MSGIPRRELVLFYGKLKKPQESRTDFHFFAQILNSGFAVLTQDPEFNKSVQLN